MNKALSVTTTTLLLLLIANVFVDVVLRYAFNNSSIAFNGFFKSPNCLLKLT
jgi:TRAP-type mannitol/chloroaromatic compound transport system permease small subunit